MNPSARRLLPSVMFLLATSCGSGGGADSTGNGSDGACVLAAQKPTGSATCCNGMKPDSQGVCRQVVGGPCYSDNLPNVVPSGSDCCNANGGSTYLGKVGSCSGSGNCAGDATCRLGDVCDGNGFCGGGCLTVSEGTASAQDPCCPGLTADASGHCYPPAGHACNDGTECASHVCKAGATTATCQ